MKPIFSDQPDPTSIDLIDAYLRGELDTHAMAEVDVRRTTDKEFDDLFIGLVQLAAASRAAHLESKLEMLRAQAKSQPPIDMVAMRRRRMIRRVAAAAIVLLLIAAGTRMLLPQEHEKLFNAHFTIDLLPGKGELSAHPPHDWKAHDHYARGQFSRAADEFDKLLITHPDSEYLLFSAVSHLGAGHLNRAEKLLTRALEVFPENAEEIIFYYTLLHIRRNDYAAAKTLLDEHRDIISGNRHLERLRDVL